MTTRIGKVLLMVVFIAGGLLFPFQPIAKAQPNTDLSLTFLNDGYYKNVEAGQPGDFLIEVRNNGTETLAGIVFSATVPEGWTISFQPQSIASLSPGNFQTVKIAVTTLKSTPVNTYQVPISADTASLHQSITSTINIQSPKGFWWLIGGIVAAVVIAGFIFIYLRFGRR